MPKSDYEKSAAPRVALVGSDFNRRQGAAGVMSEIARRAARDYDVTVIARTIESSEGVGLTLTPVRAPARPSWVSAPWTALSATRLARRGRFDIVHTHDSFSFGADIYTAHSSFKGYLEQRREVGSFGFRMASHVYPPHLALLALSRGTFLSRGARIVTVSGSVRDELLAHYPLDPARVSVIYNGVDIDRFAVKSRHAERQRVSSLVRTELDDQLVLLFVGHEFGRKRLGTAIRALASSSARSSAQLLVAGGDDPAPYRQIARENGVGDRVHFLGVRNDIPQIMAASDVFVFPTEYEAASLAILEAAAAGLALVTTDTAMAHEVLRDGRDSVLLDNSSDPIALTRALDLLAADRPLMHRLRAEARKTASRYTWDHAWSAYDAIYRQVIDERSHRFATHTR